MIRRRHLTSLVLAIALACSACSGTSLTPTAPAFNSATAPPTGADGSLVPLPPESRAPIGASGEPVLGTGSPGGPTGAATADPGASASSPAEPTAPAASPGSPLPTAPGGLDILTAAALQAVVDQARETQHVPGMSVAIRLADGRTWEGVSGDRQLSQDQPVDPDTVFAIASITKTFVTAVVMQLVHAGKLSLDDPLSRWMPDFPRADAITIRELLGHTAGVFNYFEDPGFRDAVFADKDRRWTVDEILSFVDEPYCDPGTCYHYSNTDFILLGRVVEMVTHKPVADVIKSRLLDPLGLSRTVFQPDQPTPRDAASGYLYGDGTWHDQTGGRSVIPHPSVVTMTWAAGAMASTASDLATWAEQLYSGDVVAPDLLDQMLTFPLHHDHYGLGTRMAIFDGRRAVGHGGSLRGFQDEMFWFPREGASIVVLGNLGFYDVASVVRSVARTLFTGIGAGPPEYRPWRNTH